MRVLVVVLLMPFLTAFLWNWGMPILFPKAVSEGYFNARLDWWGGLAVSVVLGMVAKPKVTVNRES